MSVLHVLKGYIMQFFRVLGALSAIFICFSITLQAQASSKPWVFGWSPYHWQNLDFDKPYLEESTTRHNSQWEFDHWRPQDWIESRGSADAVMENLYTYGIITKQYMDDDFPVLEVGLPFIQLSGQEKRRVTAFVDHVFGITRNPETGMYRLREHGTKRELGLFTRYGLQIQ